MHNELKAFLALCIYICIMCWKAIWKKNGKAVKGLSEGTFWKFLHTTESCQNSCYLSEGTFWKFLHTTGSCQNSCYLTPWLLYAYIYAQSEKAFNSQCKHSIVLRHVFFKKWTITPLKKSSSANFDGVPLCIRVSDPLAVNSLSKGDTSPTKRSLPRANRTGGCCRGLCWIQAPPCQNCMKKSPLADFDRVPLCIRVSNPLMVNSLSKGDISPTRRSLPRANCTGGCCRGLCRSWTPPCQNCMKKSPSADFDGVPLCIRVSNPLAVNSLSKGDTSPTRRSLPRANQTGGCCRGLCRSWAPLCQNCMCNLQCHSENIK